MSDLSITQGAAVGMIANLCWESAGMTAGIQEAKPLGKGKGGLGWAQWTGPRRVLFVNFCGARVNTDACNLDFFMHELKTTYKRCVSLPADAKEATFKFERCYERAGIPHYEGRYGMAAALMKALGSG